MPSIKTFIDKLNYCIEKDIADSNPLNPLQTLLNIKKAGDTNPSLYSGGLYWFDTFMSVIPKNITDYNTFSKELKKLNISILNIDINGIGLGNAYDDLKTQYTSGQLSILIHDSNFDKSRGIEITALNQSLWSLPIGDFVGNYEQIYLYEAYLEAGSNYKSVVLPYKKDTYPKQEEVLNNTYTPLLYSNVVFNVEDMDIFKATSGTFSGMSFYIIPDDGSAYIFEDEDELGEEYIEGDFMGDEEEEFIAAAIAIKDEYIEPLKIPVRVRERIVKEKNIPNVQSITLKNVTKAQDFWTLVALCSREDDTPQGWADVAQTVYNRLGSGVYNANTIAGVVTSRWQYEPTWRYPNGAVNGRGSVNKEWFVIKDASSASRACGKSVDELNQVAAALQNTTYQNKAKTFIQGRTDFFGTTQPANKMTQNGTKRQRDSTSNKFGFTYTYKDNVTYNVAIQ